MIDSDAGLSATRVALAHLEDALRDLTRQRATYHPATFALLAAPIADAIQAHRAGIDDYIGLLPADRVASATASPQGDPLAVA